MKFNWLTLLNLILLGSYGVWPSRYSWYALLLPLIFTITYYLIGQGTTAARQLVLIGNSALLAYFVYNGLDSGYSLSVLFVIVYAGLRIIKLDRQLRASTFRASQYILLEFAVYALAATAAALVGFDNPDAIVWAGVTILIARELTELDLMAKFSRAGTSD